MAVVVHRKARVAAMTVIVQAVMIGGQVVVVAQQANPPMAIDVKRGQPVLAVLKAAAAQTVIVVQIVIAALKGAMIKPAQLAAASRHLVASQLAVTSQHLVTSQHAVTS